MKLNIRRQELSPELKRRLLKAMSLLPEMRVADTDLNDSVNFDANNNQRWRQENSESGAFTALAGAFFRTQMVKVTVTPEGKKPVQWVQPFTKARTEEIEDQDGNIIKVAGLVISLYDEYQRVLMRMINEPGARAVFIGEKEVHPKLAMAMQTSVAKLDAVMAGDTAKDPSLAKLLPILEKSKMTFDSLEWRALDSGHDTNRQDGVVLYTSLVVSPRQLSQIAKEIGGMVFLYKESREIVHRTSLLNPHALVP